MGRHVPMPELNGPMVLHTGTPPSSLFDKLPPMARDRYRELKQRADDLYALQPEGNRVREAAEEKHKAQRHLDKLLAPAGSGGWALAEDDVRVIAAKKNLATLADEATRLSELYRTRSEARQGVSQTLGAVTTWLRELPADTLEDIAPPVVTLGKGEDLLGTIKKYRAQVDELRARLKEIARAPITQAMARQLCARSLRNTHSAVGRKSTPYAGRQDRLAYSNRACADGQYRECTTPDRLLETVDALGLFVFTFQKELTARIDNLITEQASSDGVSDEDRARQTREAADKLRLVERQVCSLIERARAEWLPANSRAS